MDGKEMIKKLSWLINFYVYFIMTPYIGQFLLNLSAFLAFLPLTRQTKLQTLKKWYTLHVICLALAFGWLIICHLGDDFSLMNVVRHSHTQKPWLYKLAGTWGNHEGSMLLWVMLLAFFGLHALKDNSQPPATQVMRLILHSGLNFLFICFLVLACDPFAVVVSPPLEGLDLNPLLQDPLLAIHPPFLYAGYVGFVVPFIYVISHVFHQNPVLLWIGNLRPLVLLAWTFLSMGLGLGCFWAYYELGWGGWWFWDPVENIALIPWLLGLMFIHCSLNQAHQQQTVKWVIILSILTFISSLIGTLLVRSGSLVSVHSFAVDPARGMLLLGLVVVIAFSSVALVIKRFPLSLPQEKGVFNQSVCIRVALILTSAALFTLTFGTLYPVASSALGYPVTVGGPYFQMTFVPMVMPILILLGFIPWLQWRYKTDWRTLVYRISPSLTSSGFSIVILWFLEEIGTLKEILVSWLALWVIFSTLFALKGSLLNRRRIGISLAHFGMGLAILGMILSSAKEQEQVKAVVIGESFSMASFQIRLKGIEIIKGPNYMAQQAQIEITKQGKKVATLTPEKRFYWTKGLIHGETAIYSNAFSHLYIALGEEYEGNIWSLRLYYKPYINLLWVGMACMVMAGLILLTGRFLGIKKTFLVFFLLPISFSFALEAHEILPNSLAEQRALHVGKMILCPTCAGQNINDSVAEEAGMMRQQVRQFITQGASDAEILDIFVEQYGQKILYQPAFSFSNILLWVLPWLVFLGCLLLASRLRRQ